MAPWETAGATPLLVQSNWMNLGRFGTNVTLTDSNGLPTAVIASWMADGMWHAHGTGGNASFPSVVTNDSKLMDGFIECTWTYDGPNVAIPPGTSILALTNTDQPIIFLTGLGSFISTLGIGSTYSVIIYANTDGEGQGRVGQYFVHAAHGTYGSIVDDGPAISTDNTATPPTSTVTPVLFDAQTNEFNGSNYTMVPVTATNSANAAWGNYIEFDGLTNDTILIRTQNGGSPAAPINGIQIVCLGIAIPPSPNTSRAYSQQYCLRKLTGNSYRNCERHSPDYICMANIGQHRQLYQYPRCHYQHPAPVYAGYRFNIHQSIHRNFDQPIFF